MTSSIPKIPLKLIHDDSAALRGTAIALDRC